MKRSLLHSLPWIITAMTLLALYAFISFVPLRKPEPARSPHVILISIETTRADHLSAYGYKRKTSPTIDQLAREGVLFSNMFTTRGLTQPSLASLMTSLYPVNNGVRKNSDFVSAETLTLAEILRSNGYQCAAFLALGHPEGWKAFNPLVFRMLNDDAITADALEWMTENAHRRFFAWIHYWEPHDPYTPPKPYDTLFDPDYSGTIDGGWKTLVQIAEKKVELSEDDFNHIISLYDGGIRAADHRVDKILSHLRSLGIEKDSLIIITSDHGENLYRPHHYFGHDASIYDNVLHIPLIMKWANHLPQNTRIQSITENIDIAPTILDLLNIPVPEHFDGQSLVPLISAKTLFGFLTSFNAIHKFQRAFSEWEDKILSIRTDQHRYIFNPTGFHTPKVLRGHAERFPFEKEELHDVRNRDEKLQNIIDENPEIVQNLKQEMKEWPYFQDWLSEKNIQKDKPVPKEIEERLRSLGYIS